jgi:hypothetical protein
MRGPFVSTTNAEPYLVDDDYADASIYLGCEEAAIRAVDEVESGGSGFLPDGKIKVLFEGHIFYRYTKGKFATSNPDICYQTWTTKFYSKGDTQTRGNGELDRLQRAIKLDRKAALMSASYGRFQVMGFNFATCGYKDVEAFFADMQADETKHLEAFINYVVQNRLDDDLIHLDWAGFAKGYNGPQYTKNAYDTKLKSAYDKWTTKLSATA